MSETIDQLIEEGEYILKKIMCVFLERNDNGNTRITAYKYYSDNSSTEKLKSIMFEGRITDEKYDELFKKLVEYNRKLVYKNKEYAKRFYKELLKILGENIDVTARVEEIYPILIFSEGLLCDVRVAEFRIKVIDDVGDIIDEIKLEPIVVMQLVDETKALFFVLEDDLKELLEEIKE